MDRQIAELVARQRITDVILRLARAFDRCDWELAAECFDAEGTIDIDPDTVGPAVRQDFLARMRGDRTAYDGRWLEMTMHYMSNILIELDDRCDAAHVESYGTAIHRSTHSLATIPVRLRDRELLVDGSRSHDFVTGTRFVDRFVRRGEAWKIARRVVVFEWTRVDPVGATYDVRTLGRRDRSDLVYRGTEHIGLPVGDQPAVPGHPHA